MNNAILKKYFPTKDSADTEIINLKAILNLPKGTEHFLSDLHGEYQTFNHLLKNASGVIKQKIQEAFGNFLKKDELDNLATVIYYPHEVLKNTKIATKNLNDWYKSTLLQLIEIARVTASKYTRSKVRKALPKTFGYILDELIHAPVHNENKEEYYENILLSVIELGQADNLIIELSTLIQKLSIDRLHIIGDIFDRGSGADKIIDTLMEYHSIDIQWGNHDILWIGAYFGNLACICNIIRINCLYNNLHILENGYGINLRPLSYLATKIFEHDECKGFEIKNHDSKGIENANILCKMHKLITILQLKVEEQLIISHKEYNMQDRLLLDKIGYSSKLNRDEELLLDTLQHSFSESSTLTKHINFLLQKGSLYSTYNGNLLMHGCVPTNIDGSFTQVAIQNKTYSGKSLYDKLDSLIRNCKNDKYANDYIWYLWCGKHSPVYGRNVMATFEKYFTPTNFIEPKNHYYEYVKHEDYCKKVLIEFGLDSDCGHIINGHIPVKVKDGESPISGNGKHITIDGGMSRAYHDSTGIAGYTLISNSLGLFLVSHSPFTSTERAIIKKEDLQSDSTMIEKYPHRIFVKDTDIGKEIKEQIDILLNLYK